MDIDITLDQLPEDILEEIFAFLPKNYDLRLVCKTFRDIIDNSPQLMKDKWLIVDKIVDIDSSTINHYYQKLKLTDLNFEALNWLCCYQHKDRIKTIMIKCIKRGIVRPLSVQYIMSNFNFMETLHIQSFFIGNDGDLPINHLKLIPNKSSKLKTLLIDYIPDHPNNVLDMFSEIPTIKNLHIHDFKVLKFPKDVKWKLEKLIATELYSSMVADNENCKEFLLSQQSTLKKLTLPEYNGFTSFIVRNLPNLESLTLGLEDNEEINTESLISNGRLERLFLQRFFWDTENIFKVMLQHYNRIKYLSIDCDIDFKSINIKIPNVTHLMLKKPNSLGFLIGNYPNVKTLGLSLLNSEDEFNLDDVSNEGFKDIEKFCYETEKACHIFQIIKKCPQLYHLNLCILDWTYDQTSFFVSHIDRILEVLPQLKSLGLTERILKAQKVKYYELLDHIKNKKLILKIYKNFESMIAEDWGCEDTETISIC